MKRLLFLIVTLLITNFINAQKYIDNESYVWEIRKPKNFSVKSGYWGITISNDTIEATIRPQYNIVEFTLTNVSKDRISIIWNESSMGNYDMSNIVFGDMRMIQIGNPIPNSYLNPNDILTKQITGSSLAAKKAPIVNYSKNKKMAKKNKMKWNDFINISLVVEYNNEKKIYKIELLGTYEKEYSKKERDEFNKQQ